ncbi:uncharacterized protein LOC121410387 isoform X1 [Lytechinus variegatus]|uniref:uncharacterized protein LOC121410387 isoform X1 n=2 Tax=Lytechinus variegatus TaxID=7654 RepID=UPI001BB12B7A|nr:uncharacterized protein LOC121410387 isoform X1 [Lytechinus variegatus]
MASPIYTKVSSMCLPENFCTTSCSMFSPSKLRQHNSLPNSPCSLRSHHHHHHSSCGRGKLVEVPLWFHGLMERKVAEELLLKSPFRGHTSGKEGLFLVRQSSNRGGHFVISVCTRNHCNHYLIETIESMFYVRRDRSEDRGRDIQACDLRNLIQCYRTTPLDESGLVLKEPLLRTTPVTITTSLLPLPQPRDNHNYIPLHVEHKEYVANQDYAAPDPVMLSFCEGELLTVLQKDNKNWWFGHNDRRELGYIPAALLRSLTESQPTEKSAFLNAGYVGNEEATKTDAGIDTSSLPLTDCNSNFMSENQNKGNIHMQRIHTVPCGLTLRNCGNEDIYVSSEYITSCLENRDRWMSPELPRLGVLRCVSPRQLQRHLSEPTAWIDFSVKPERLIDVEPQDLMHFSDMSPDVSPTHTFSGRRIRHKAARQNSSPARGSNISSSAESSPVRRKKDSMTDYMTTRDYDPIETYLRLSECTTGPSHQKKGKTGK